MPSGRSIGVQFKGIFHVTRAFHNMKITNWGIFNGRDLLEAYEGTDFDEAEQMLKQYLTELQEGRSNAYYSLCVYDEKDFPKDDRIRPATPCTRSFKFSLFEEFQSSPQTESFYQQMMQRMDAMEAKLSLDDEDGEKDEIKREGGISGILNGLMEDPAVKQAIGDAISVGIAKIIEFFKKPIQAQNQLPMQPQPAAMGSAPDPSQLEKIQKAVSDLWEVDKNLGDHLVAIATIAKSDPGKYHKLISMLNFL